jgi:two-component system chemotaxis response regulator CheB
VKARGGVAIVQDPTDASYPDMPRNALEAVAVDHVLPLREIAPLLARVTAAPLDAAKAADDPELKLESQAMTNDDFTMQKLDQLGNPSKLTCPECGGALWEMHNPPTRFRCHVGHAYSLHTLFSEQNVQVEAALWAAVRALDQVAHIARRLADQAHKGSRPKSAETFREFADDSTRHADRLRELLEASVGSAAPAS